MWLRSQTLCYYNFAMNIYFDIDGVILTKEWKPAPHLKEFLTYFIERYPVYWLTTHCKADANRAVSYLETSLDKETLDLVKKIKPTNWSYSKTEAINFKEEFIWFDDYIFEFEKEQLKKNNSLNSWIRVDLRENPNHLRDILELFKDHSKITS